MLKLYRMNLDFGRMGSVDGLFLATEEQIKSLEGKQSCFGEVLGKHSDIYMNWNNMNIPVHIVELGVSEQTILDLNKHSFGGTIVGYNPVEYIYEEEDDDYKGH